MFLAGLADIFPLVALAQNQSQAFRYYSTESLMETNKALPAATETATVADLDGNKIVLSSLWENRKITLVFIRHFG